MNTFVYQNSTTVASGNIFKDTSGLNQSSVYQYEVQTSYSASFNTYIGLRSLPVMYPPWYGLRQFLPPNFNPSNGIKSLRPNDHPFVSVRSIMASA
ncbi:MAG TPA: hypothetical protein VG028_06840 [Terriglobia bacterium]|nr:hypothetical protein [Terriglobia bacterium]